MSRRIKQVVIAACTLITCLAGTSEATNAPASMALPCAPGNYILCLDHADMMLCGVDGVVDSWACADLVEMLNNCGVVSGGYVGNQCDYDAPGDDCPYTDYELHCPGINE